MSPPLQRQNLLVKTTIFVIRKLFITMFIFHLKIIHKNVNKHDKHILMLNGKENTN